jgi:hypothetical protein
MGKGKRKRAQIAERHGFDSSGMLGHDAGAYAVNVSELVAASVDVVLACVRIIGDLISDADVGEYRGAERLDDSRLTRRPMATITRRTWLWQVAATMALYNGQYIRDDLAGTDSEGVPMSLVPVAPVRVSWDDPHSPRIDGESVDVNALHWIPRMTFPTLDRSTAYLVSLARDSIAASWAAESYRADFWQSGGAPVTILTSDQPLTKPDAELYRDQWTTARADGPGKPAVLGKGLEAKLFGADVSTKGASEAGERLGTSICRYFGMPAWLANVPSAAGSMTYSNASAAGLDLVRYTLRPGYAGPIGDFLSDVLPGDYLQGRRVVLGLDHITAPAMLERYQAWAIATGKPWMAAGEVRKAEHLPLDASFDLDPAGAPAPALEVIDAAPLP